METDNLSPGYRGVVQAWECDQIGHLNVSHHFGRASDQGHFIRHMFGLTPDFLKREGKGTVALEEHARFHREALSGEVLIAHSAPVEIHDRHMVVFTEIRNGEDLLVTTFRTVIGYFDLNARKLNHWPDMVLAKANPLQMPLPDYATPKFLSAARIETAGITVEKSKTAGFNRYGGAAINAWECDQFGHMNTMFYVRRFTEAVASFWNAAGMSPQKMRETKTSFVVGEMKLAYVSELLAGDICETYSGLAALSDKTICIEHRIFNTATGALAAVGRVRGVCFNLQKRCAQTIPPELAQALTKFTIRPKHG